MGKSPSAARRRTIAYVETTPEPVVDRDVLAPVYATLAIKDLLPSTHLVNAAYVGAGGLIASRRNYRVKLVGRAPKDQEWQVRTNPPTN